MNGPGTSFLLAGYASTVSYSKFGMRGSHSANRTTALYLQGNQTGAYYNNIDYAGTAGINLSGTYQYAYANTLVNNRYENPGIAGGGQMFVGPEHGDGPRYASVAANIIDGNFWKTPSGQNPTVNGCPVTPNVTISGVEANGTGNRFYNNSVFHHTGGGMSFGNDVSNSILISSSNPWNPSDSPKYVTANG